jgi:hypothetical protein
MFHALDDVGSCRYELSSGGAIGAGDVELWLKEAKLELGSNAWAGVEDFNWLKKVIVVVIVQSNRIVFLKIASAATIVPALMFCAGEEPELVDFARSGAARVRPRGLKLGRRVKVHRAATLNDADCHEHMGVGCKNRDG